MKIIFDSGSTSVSAAIIPSDREPIFISIGRGYNATTSPAGELESILRSDDRIIRFAPEIRETDYYGAGCRGETICSRVRDTLLRLFPNSTVSVESDMLCAAKALCSDQPGIACILGTGANSCLWDGKEIICNVPPLGYILGDEGSGAVLGRLFLGKMLKRQFPEEIIVGFKEKYDLDTADIIQRTYREPGANAFLASFAPFILDQAGRHEEISGFVIDEFRRFLQFNVMNYSGCRELPIGFIGSIAWHFRKYLGEALRIEGLTPGKILREPLAELVKMNQSLNMVVNPTSLSNLEPLGR